MRGVAQTWMHVWLNWVNAVLVIVSESYTLKKYLVGKRGFLLEKATCLDE